MTPERMDVLLGRCNVAMSLEVYDSPQEVKLPQSELRELIETARRAKEARQILLDACDSASASHVSLVMVGIKLTTAINLAEQLLGGEQ